MRMRRSAVILVGLTVFGLAVVALLSDKCSNEGVASLVRAAANRIDGRPEWWYNGVARTSGPLL